MSLEEVSEALLEALPAMERPVLMAIGNDINADDGLGPLIIKKLESKLAFFRPIDAGTLPENFVSKIASIRPSHLVIIDAAMVEGEPGTIGLVDPDKVDDVIFTTHHIPLGMSLKRLLNAWPCTILIIGVRPGSMEIGGDMTPAVSDAAEDLGRLILELDDFGLKQTQAVG